MNVDLLFVLLIVTCASYYLVRRFIFAKTPPSPPVQIGSNLAKGLLAVQKKRRC